MYSTRNVIKFDLCQNIDARIAGFTAAPREIEGFPWIFTKIYENAWKSLGIHGNHGFGGNPWIVTKINIFTKINICTKINMGGGGGV